MLAPINKQEQVLGGLVSLLIESSPIKRFHPSW